MEIDKINQNFKRVQKNAYLTIDDTPSDGMKMKVDYLLSHKIPAILFCVGENLKMNRKQAIYALEHGYYLGNHSQHHPHFSEISIQECKNEIRETDKLLREIHKEAGISDYPRIFRFPFGDKGCLTGPDYFQSSSEEGSRRKNEIQSILRDLGYTQLKFVGITYEYTKDYPFFKDIDWLWTYDVMEWSIHLENPVFGIDSLEKVFDRMEEDFPEEGRGLNFGGSEDIILLHDHPETDDMFIPIISRLLEKGVRFRDPFKQGM